MGQVDLRHGKSKRRSSLFRLKTLSLRFGVAAVLFSALLGLGKAKCCCGGDIKVLSSQQIKKRLSTDDLTLWKHKAGTDERYSSDGQFKMVWEPSMTIGIYRLKPNCFENKDGRLFVSDKTFREDRAREAFLTGTTPEEWNVCLQKCIAWCGDGVVQQKGCFEN